jgi:hypothetical protein
MDRTHEIIDELEALAAAISNVSAFLFSNEFSLDILQYIQLKRKYIPLPQTPPPNHTNIIIINGKHKIYSFYPNPPPHCFYKQILAKRNNFLFVKFLPSIFPAKVTADFCQFLVKMPFCFDTRLQCVVKISSHPFSGFVYKRGQVKGTILLSN